MMDELRPTPEELSRWVRALACSIAAECHCSFREALIRATASDPQTAKMQLTALLRAEAAS